MKLLVYKGGRLVPVYKKGDPKECCNYRSLFVSSVVGKALHSIFRQELGPHFDKVVFRHALACSRRDYEL